MHSETRETTGSYMAMLAVIIMLLFDIYSMAHVWH